MKFQEVNTITYNKEEISIEKFKKENPSIIGVFKSDKYQVIKRRVEAKDSTFNIIWLSIKKLNKESVHDWRDLQEIKNELVGKENEGVEIYPAESRKVDGANQYHLWVYENPELRIPFGFNERLVTDSVSLNGAVVQRPFNND